MYQDSVFSMDEKVLHDVEPSLTMMKERIIANINVEVDKTNDPLSDIPAMRTFISTKRHTSQRHLIWLNVGVLASRMQKIH